MLWSNFLFCHTDWLRRFLRKLPSCLSKVVAKTEEPQTNDLCLYQRQPVVGICDCVCTRGKWWVQAIISISSTCISQYAQPHMHVATSGAWQDLGAGDLHSWSHFSFKYVWMYLGVKIVVEKYAGQCCRCVAMPIWRQRYLYQSLIDEYFICPVSQYSLTVSAPKL